MIRRSRPELDPKEKRLQASCFYHLPFQWCSITLCLCKNTFWTKCFDSEKSKYYSYCYSWTCLMLRWTETQTSWWIFVFIGPGCLWCLLDASRCKKKTKSQFCKYNLFSCGPSVMWLCKGWRTTLAVPPGSADAARVKQTVWVSVAAMLAPQSRLTAWRLKEQSNISANLLVLCRLQRCYGWISFIWVCAVRMKAQTVKTTRQANTAKRAASKLAFS